MNVKESLKILRTELDMTQLELAGALGVTHKTVSRCTDNLKKSLYEGRKKMLRVPRSKLYPVDKESICDLVDRSHNAVFVSDLETNEILYANREAERYVGHKYTPGEKCYHFMYDRELPCQRCPKEQMLEDESTNYHIVSAKNGRHYLFRGHRLNWNGRPAHADYFFEEKTELEAADGGGKNLRMRAKFIRRENNKSLYYCMIEDVDWGTKEEPFGGDGNA